LLVAMYVFALATTLAAAGILGRTVIRGRRIPLLLELPPYRLPSLRAILRMVWDRASVFLKEAGTVILACTVVLWALLSYPKPPADVATAATANSQLSAPAAPAAEAKTPIEYSLGGKLGKAIEPVIEPLGFDWKLGIGLIGAFAAREVFVATMGLVFGIDDLDDEAVPLRERMKNERDAAGKPRYTPLIGVSLMVFVALSCQCMSTLAVVRRETKSWRWPAFLFAYMTALAYGASLLVYQGGRLLGL
jgi:ferrous iron transport protein B